MLTAWSLACWEAACTISGIRSTAVTRNPFRAEGAIIVQPATQPMSSIAPLAGKNLSPRVSSDFHRPTVRHLAIRAGSDYSRRMISLLVRCLMRPDSDPRVPKCPLELSGRLLDKGPHQHPARMHQQGVHIHTALRDSAPPEQWIPVSWVVSLGLEQDDPPRIGTRNVLVVRHEEQDMLLGRKADNGEPEERKVRERDLAAGLLLSQLTPVGGLLIDRIVVQVDQIHIDRLHRENHRIGRLAPCAEDGPRCFVTLHEHIT